MKIRSGLPELFCIIGFSFLFSFSALSNPRLDGVQRTYFEGVNAFISIELKRLYARYFHLLSNTHQRSSEEFKRQLLLVEKNFLYGVFNATGYDDYQSLLASQQHVNLANARVADSVQNIKDQYRRLERQLSILNQKRFCEAAVQSMPLKGLPSYKLDDHIDLRSLQQLRQDRIKPWVGSENESADKIEKSLYLPATTGGCILAQTFLPFLPIVGCLIGAAAGAATAFVTGRVGSIVITEYQNSQERGAYEIAIHSERQRQEQEIAQARQWMIQHPINDGFIRLEILAGCAQFSGSWQQEILSEAGKYITYSAESAHRLDLEAKEMLAEKAHLREQTLENLKQANELIVKNRIRGMTADLKSVSALATSINGIRRVLSTCLLEKSAFCGEMITCVDEAQHEFDNSGIQDEEDNAGLAASVLLESELKMFRQELLLCSNEGNQ